MMIVNEEIKEFIEFRTDEDGTYFYYNDKDNTEQWSYKLDDLKEYITNLQQENARLKDKINMAIKYYEANQQECVIGRNKDEKLIKEYYLPAQCSKKLLDILK